MKKKLFALSGVFLIVLVVTGLWATRATDLLEVQEPDLGTTSLATGVSMQEMVERSSLILIGQCLETRSEWVERRLITRATVSVTEFLKGAAPETVTVTLPGGIDSNRRFPIAMNYAGAPQMSPQESVVLFLTDNGEVENSYAVMGFSAGKFSVVEDSAGEKFVARDLTKEPIQTGAGMRRGNLQVVPLSEFRERVRSLLR